MHGIAPIKKPPVQAVFLMLVRFAAFPAGCVAKATQARLSPLILVSGTVKVKHFSYGNHTQTRVLSGWPFPPPRKRALASGEDVPWP